MAKKKTDTSPEAPTAAPEGSPAGEASEVKKAKTPKDSKEKGVPGAKAKSKTKPDSGAATEEKLSPASPAADQVPTAAVSATGPDQQSSRRKGRRPGYGPRRGKKLRGLLQTQQDNLAKGGPVPLPRAVAQLKQMKRAKFDETVEIHMALGIDPGHSDQIVRGTVPLPHGIGKSVRVLVFCQGDNVNKAKEAGADFAGGDDLIKKIQQENWLDFDVALATQDMMGMVSRLGKLLGPRGLMPTPKAGTVITAGSDVGSAVREFKAGKVEYRADKGGNVHAGVGKMSFDEQKLVENVTAFVDQVRAAKPASVKGNYIKSITLSATMSQGVPITVQG